MLFRYVLGILFVFLVFPLNGFSAESSISAADQTCMMCHSQEQDMTFDAGEKLSVKVNIEENKNDNIKYNCN